MTGLSKERILDRLPFLGLDIESDGRGLGKDRVQPEQGRLLDRLRNRQGAQGPGRVRRSGSRPTTSPRGRSWSKADANLSKVRPWIACAVVRGLRLGRRDGEAAHLHAGGPPQRHRQEEEEGRDRPAQPGRDQASAPLPRDAGVVPVHPSRFDEEDDDTGDSRGRPRRASLTGRY